MDANVLSRVFACLRVDAILRQRCVSKTWAVSSDQPELWMAVARRHFSSDIWPSISGRPSFVQTVTFVREVLRMEPRPRFDWLLRIARCPQPCPPREEDGVSLLTAHVAHSRATSMVRMDDETMWVSQLPEEDQADVYLRAMQLLELLCEQSPEVRNSAQKTAFNHAGFMDLPSVLEEHVLEHLPRLKALRPIALVGHNNDPVFLGFETRDCRLLEFSTPSLQMLRASCSIYFLIFSEEEDVSQESELLSRLIANSGGETDRATLAMELSGHWRTAMYLSGKRIDGVPGNFEMQFEQQGVVAGRGRDSWGEFELEGFWTPQMLFLQKTTQRNYTVELYGFIRDDGTLRGTWHFNGRAGGFWGCKGAPREFARGPRTVGSNV